MEAAVCFKKFFPGDSETYSIFRTSAWQEEVWTLFFSVLWFGSLLCHSQIWHSERTQIHWPLFTHLVPMIKWDLTHTRYYGGIILNPTRSGSPFQIIIWGLGRQDYLRASSYKSLENQNSTQSQRSTLQATETNACRQGSATMWLPAISEAAPAGTCSPPLLAIDVAESLRKANTGCLLSLDVSDRYNKRWLA